MDVGIIGFARSGKTTLFNALTGSKAETGVYHARGAEPNLAVVKVPDPRVDSLVEMFKPPKIVHATITYIDVPGIEPVEGRPTGGLDEGLLRAVANCDELMAVIRGFEQEGRAPKVEGEIQNIQLELVLSDLAKVETRLERIDKSISKITGDPRLKMEVEKATLDKCKALLEEEKPVRSGEFSPEEDKVLRTFQFMTVKPLLIVINVGEEEIATGKEWETRASAKELPPFTALVACSAKSEMDISRIESEEERREFLESFGIAEPAAARIIRVSYATLGLISFFTAGPTEVHAWTLRKGQPITRAAGTIHSDMERGFIRADVIGCDALLKAGSMAAAKKEGTFRLEGKSYVTQDGDVIEIRFSV